MADLSRLPITSRSDIQTVPPEEIVARNADARRFVERHTSGSTGRPLTIRRTWLEDQVLGVFLWRALFDLGVAPGDHLVSVHLTSADSDRRSAGPVRRPRLRHVFGVDCRAQPDAILRMLHAVRATVIMGFPGVLARVAGKVSDKDRRTLPLRLVSPFGGVLTPLTRSRLAEGFGAPVRLEPSGKLRPSRSLVASEYDGIEWESSSSASS